MCKITEVKEELSVGLNERIRDIQQGQRGMTLRMTRGQPSKISQT